jgi:endonuclease VIII-like 1
MPELSEVKIQGDFVNHIISQDPYFEIIEKSSSSKVNTELEVFDGGIFTMYAKTRGKEMRLHLEMVGGDINGAVTKNLMVTLGMSGSFVYVRGDSEHFDKVLKHGHLRFKTTRGNYLVLHDVRRFAKWKWGEDWNSGRGPCPLTEYNEFVGFLKPIWYSKKQFSGKLNELLMNQKYFNGIGNYLRAEILYRLDVNPFQPANELPIEKLEELLQLCYSCTSDAYILNGGKLKDWSNPNSTVYKQTSFNEWMKCYNVLSSVNDNIGRRFWYDPKWEKFVPTEYIQK